MNKVLASLLILVFGSQYNISNASMKNTDDENVAKFSYENVYEVFRGNVDEFIKNKYRILDSTISSGQNLNYQHDVIELTSYEAESLPIIEDVAAIVHARFETPNAPINPDILVYYQDSFPSGVYRRIFYALRNNANKIGDPELRTAICKAMDDISALCDHNFGAHD